jgi:hypothetical protein
VGRVDDVPVWSLSCFYVRREHPRRGVMSALIAPALEAYPVDTSAPSATSNLFPGTASAFRRATFTTTARRSAARPVMRHDLGDGA